MAYALSPGVTVIEKDFTSIVPAVASTTGAFAGHFSWGPILYPIRLSSENELVAQFGKPTLNNFESFFTAANFLSYTNSLYVSRADSILGKNAIGNTDSSQITTGTAVKIKNVDDYNTTYSGSTNASHWVAKYVGTLGNSLKVSFADSNTFKNIVSSGTATTAIGAPTLVGVGTKFLTELHVGAFIKNSANLAVGVVTSITNDTTATITAATTALTGEGFKIDWAYASQFDSAPGTSSFATGQNATNDELHVIVIDKNGLFSGTAGTILEKFAFVSKAFDARTFDGTNNYYKDVINNTSKYIWWMKHSSNVAVTGSAWGLPAAGLTFKSLIGAMLTSFNGGTDASAIGISDYTTDAAGAKQQEAWMLFLDDSQYDISLLPLGKATATTANYVLQNLAEVRKDCVAFVSPQKADGSVITGSGSAATDLIVGADTGYRSLITSSSYGFMDTGYKYQYDRYNDVYRWVPLSGDMAGLAARTDYTNDAWWSPAGFNRGQIKNVVKLAINPSKSDRDELYKNGVNPVVSFPGQGVILYGDKTLLAKPSAFDRINVRRLFIVLEKSIAIASKYQLFEFNDAFTRAQFKNVVEPFLRDVKGRRGITDFKVVCDSTNNTGEVIDRNEFIGDIYIKPSRSINFITLNFIATRTGVDFTTVGA